MVDTTEMLRIYCDMTPDQADSLMALHQGDRISDYKFNAFVDAGLVLPNRPHGQAHTITMLGMFVMGRIASIWKLTFNPIMAGNFTAAEVIELTTDHARFARMELPLKYGLNSSAHIKALVQVAVLPGAARGYIVKYLRLAAGWLPVDLLIEQGLVVCREPNINASSNHAPLFPTERGLAILNWCLNKAGE